MRPRSRSALLLDAWRCPTWSIRRHGGLRGDLDVVWTVSAEAVGGSTSVHVCRRRPDCAKSHQPDARARSRSLEVRHARRCRSTSPHDRPSARRRADALDQDSANRAPSTPCRIRSPGRRALSSRVRCWSSQPATWRTSGSDAVKWRGARSRGSGPGSGCRRSPRRPRRAAGPAPRPRRAAGRAPRVATKVGGRVCSRSESSGARSGSSKSASLRAYCSQYQCGLGRVEARRPPPAAHDGKPRRGGRGRGRRARRRRRSPGCGAPPPGRGWRRRSRRGRRTARPRWPSRRSQPTTVSRSSGAAGNGSSGGRR